MQEILSEIITIGDEILIGQILDTNSAWLGQQLSYLGIRVKQISSVSDNKEHILSALKEASSRTDLIIITGGLGPTKDDITKNTLAAYFNCEMVLHEPTLQRVEEIFSTRNLPLLEVNRLQALVPKNCTVIENTLGTAPGMWFEEEGKVYVSMPGVPSEMKAIFSEGVVARIKQQFTMPSIIHRTLLTAGIGESFLAEKIKDIEARLPHYIKLAYLPGLGQVRLRLTGYADDATKLDIEIDTFVQQIKSKAPSYFFGEGDDTLEKYIGRVFTDNQWTLSIAESFTGGYISHLITEVSGSSAYFMGAVVAYDNEVKINKLGVQRQTIISHGSVSEQTIIEMAEGCRKSMNTDYAIATSGVAGPSGGTASKPVGTCWIAIACPNGKTIAKHYHMGNDRHNTIHRSGIVALDLLRKIVDGLV